MTVRMDALQKAQFDSLCEQFGMSANTAINIFVKAVIRTESIPFNIESKQTKEEDIKKGIEAIRSMRETAQQYPELTLEEINAEIDAVRSSKKAIAV